jgi:outer membrane protein OmpA-like peptidoglycan-associated protein
MGLIGKHVHEGGLSAGDLASGLSSQKSSIAAMLPKGVRDLFGGGGGEPRVVTSDTVEEPVRRVQPSDLSRSGERGIGTPRAKSRWPLIAALGGAALLLIFALRGREPPPQATGPARSAVPEGRDPGQRVARSPTDLSDSLSQALKNGSSAPVSFGAQSFQSGSPDLTATGQNSLRSVAGVMRANPSAQATISGGASDVTSGDKSSIASARAKTLHDQLVSAGIESSRIDVKASANDADTTMVVSPGK